MPRGLDASIPEQRIVEAAAVLPTYGGVTGWASLRWLGAVWFDGLAPDGQTVLPVDLVTAGRDVRSQSGFAVTHERIRPDQLLLHDGLRIADATYSTAFVMRRAVSWREAAVHASMAAYSDVVSRDEVAWHLATENGWEGVPKARKALPYVEENAWSPWEVRMSLRWQCDCEFPRPLLNRPVFDRHGRHVGTPDLLDPEAGVLGEYNGHLHLEGTQRRKDRDRESAFRQLGLECFTVMAGDSAADIERIMREVRRRAAFEAESTRDWTIDPPSWWVPTFTVRQRRDLDDAARERLLRLRRRTA